MLWRGRGVGGGGWFFGAAWLTARQEVMDVVALPQLDFNLGIVRQVLPTRAGQFFLEFVESVPFGGQEIAPTRLAEERQ